MHAKNQDIRGRVDVLQTMRLFQIVSFASFLWKWRYNRIPVENRGKELVCRLEALGPLFVKIGQILSLQFHYFSPEVLQALEGLQRNCKGEIPLLDNKKLLDKGIQMTESAPFASGSVACVFKGRYEGKDVAVKVLRPTVLKDCIFSKKMFKWIVRIVNTLGWWKQYDVAGFARMVLDIIEHQVDLKNEVQNWEAMYSANKHKSNIIIPWLYKEVSDDEMIVMEYIDGHDLTSLKDVCDKETMTRKCREIAEFMVESLVISRVFHADIHPGNIFWTRDLLHMGFYDFGIVRHVDEDLANRIIRFYIHMYLDDVDGMSESVVKWLCNDSQDVEKFQSTIHKIIINRSKQRKGTNLIRDLQDALMKANVQINHDASLININVVNLDNMINQVLDGFDAMAEIKRVVQAMAGDGKINVDQIMLM